MSDNPSIIERPPEPVGITRTPRRETPPPVSAQPAQRATRPRLEHKWWQTSLDIRLRRIESALSLQSDATDGQKEQVRTSLRQAWRVMEIYNAQPWYRRLGRAGSTYEHALGFVLTASEDLLLVIRDDALVGYARTLRGSVKSALPVEDPRRDSYIRFLDSIVAQDTQPETDPATPATLSRRDGG